METTLERSPAFAGTAGPQRRVAFPRAVALYGGRPECGDAGGREHASVQLAPLRDEPWDGTPVCEASGNESYRLVQRHRDDGGALRGAGAWIYLGGLRFDGEHVGLDGGLCGPIRDAFPGADSGGESRVGKALAVSG